MDGVLEPELEALVAVRTHKEAFFVLFHHFGDLFRFRLARRLLDQLFRLRLSILFVHHLFMFFKRVFVEKTL